MVIGAWANRVNHRNYLLRNGAIIYAGFFVLLLVYRIGILGFAWSFPLILAPLTELKDASQMAESLRVLIEQSKLGLNQKVTISCGVAELTSSDTEASWVERADKALYEAKLPGRNKVVNA